MSLCYFNVSDGYRRAPDLEGSDHASDMEAQDSAADHARHLLAESDERGFCRRHWAMDVTDDLGALLFSLPFGHALQADRLPLSTPLRPILRRLDARPTDLRRVRCWSRLARSV